MDTYTIIGIFLGSYFALGTFFFIIATYNVFLGKVQPEVKEDLLLDFKEVRAERGALILAVAILFFAVYVICIWPVSIKRVNGGGESS